MASTSGAEQAARRDGLSVSAWVSKFIHQNIHQHYPLSPMTARPSPWPSPEHQNTMTSWPPGGAAVQRGECWRYQLRSIPVGSMVVISAQYLIDDPAVQMLYGLPLIPEDPGGLTAIPVTIGATSGWLNIARDITRVYQATLVECLGALDPADLDRVDNAIYNTCGLPL